MKFLLFVLSVLGASVGATGADWPQWRGPGGQGVSHATGVPTTWTPTSNIAWKTPIEGRGHSSPIVWRDRIFLTTSVKGEQVPGRKAPVHLGFDRKPGYVHPDSVDVDFKHALKVLAIDAASGKVLWTHTPYDGVMADDRHRKNTYASSTMATDGTLVYAFFESAGVYAYDFDGHLKWKRSLGDIIKAGLGPGSSPIIHDRLLILQCDQEMGDGSFIVALDRFTGAEVWRVNRTTRLGGSGDLTNTSAVVWRHNKGTAYVPSPILHGQYLYLMTDTGILTCLDARTGAVLYEGGRVPVPATFTASLVAAGNHLLMTSEDGDTFVVRAGSKHEVIRTNSVGEPVYASPAISDGRIYIRGERHLFAIGERP